jgi:peroxiredoxin
MALSIGDSAPDFTLYDDRAHPWTLSAQRGKKVVLLFFPGAFTSVCTTELNTVNNDLSRYEGYGAEIVGISTDAPSALAEFSKVNDFRFPLLSDHDADVAGAYGARFSRDEHRLGYGRIAKRAVFVVDEEGRLIHAEVLQNPGNQPDFDALHDALNRE